MNTTIIRQRVADFLKSHPPFDQVHNDDLLQLAGAGRIGFHESEEFVFRQGAARAPFVWVIQQGKVEILEDTAAGEQLRDLLGEGDLLGLGRFLGSPNYVHSARTASDVILYGFDATAFASLLERYPAMSRFLEIQLSAIKRYATGAASRTTASAGPADLGPQTWLDHPPPSPEFLARRLGDHPALDPGALPAVPAGQSVEQLWTTLTETRAEALIIGDPAAPAGLLTAADLALLTGRDPRAIALALDTWCTDADRPLLVERAQSIVAESFTAPWAFDRSARLFEILERAAALNLTRYAARDAGIGARWLAFGAMGRAEHTSQWTPHFGAIVESSTGPAADALAAAIQSRQPQSANPPHLRTLDEWKAFFSELIDNPVIGCIWENRSLLDLRGLTPNAATALQAHIAAEIGSSKGFIRILANDTICQLPALTFFEEFVVDLEGGAHRTLNLYSATLAPIIDSSRVFALSLGLLDCPNTMHRLAAAASAMPGQEAVLHDAAEAFRIACWLVSRHTDPVVAPASLDKYSRWLLRRVFAAIHALLDLTTRRWGLV
ncbi:MAG: putative nucleotidyltransferase substrate binding domain-containing protein [Bryobacteraceae bacterium]